jgi:hypothetical protein
MANHGGDIAGGENPRMAGRFQSWRYLDESVVGFKTGVSGPTLRCRLSAPDALVRGNFSAARENQFALQDGLHAVALDDFDTPVVKYVQECLTN